jgi:hypothetical protein
MPHPLVEKVHSKLLDGVLPREEPVKFRAGHGRGEVCMACDEPVVPAEVVYEVEMADGARLPMHQGCHGPWVVVRTRHVWGPPPRRAF